MRAQRSHLGCTRVDGVADLALHSAHCPHQLQFELNAFSVALPSELINLCGVRPTNNTIWLDDNAYINPSTTTPDVAASIGSFTGQVGVSVVRCPHIRKLTSELQMHGI